MDLVAQPAISLFGASLGYGAGAASAPDATSSAGAAAMPGSTMATDPKAAQAPFADLLVDAVGDVDRLEVQARDAVEGLMSGRGVDVHRAMIASSDAETGFELVLAVRNKALAAYQQVMGMQF